MTGSPHETSPSFLSEWREGIAELAPAMIAAMPLALLYGAIAASKGLSPFAVALSSGLVFAGGAQLAAIEMWTSPVPVAAIVLSTLLINARYVLMAASLAPKVAHMPLWARLLGFHVLADENWALAERRAAMRRLTLPYFLGAGAVFWLNWVAFSWAGAILGPIIGDPRRFGADFAFTAIFIGLVASFVTTRRHVAVVLASAAAATFTHWTLGSPWHVLAGAFAGMGMAVLVWTPAPEAAP